jgi:hypothetical protein
MPLLFLAFFARLAEAAAEHRIFTERDSANGLKS